MSLRFGPKKIKKWLENGIDVYAYFNNDVAGFAVENAKTLAKMVSSWVGQVFNWHVVCNWKISYLF